MRFHFFNKSEIARALGYQSPALQIGREFVLARTAATVERLYAECELGELAAALAKATD